MVLVVGKCLFARLTPCELRPMYSTHHPVDLGIIIGNGFCIMVSVAPPELLRCWSIKPFDQLPNFSVFFNVLSMTNF